MTEIIRRLLELTTCCLVQLFLFRWARIAWPWAWGVWGWMHFAIAAFLTVIWQWWTTPIENG